MDADAKHPSAVNHVSVTVSTVSPGFPVAREQPFFVGYFTIVATPRRPNSRQTWGENQTPTRLRSRVEQTAFSTRSLQIRPFLSLLTAQIVASMLQSKFKLYTALMQQGETSLRTPYEHLTPASLRCDVCIECVSPSDRQKPGSVTHFPHF
ncbi:hypothetical protein DPEC_G00160840 [Dallia pectoralis]|uniref:Uncharacterized protein n=1 Tax=Dallia pectoralis TaxID=75939 RepID=A0ACC2GG29_DALPE|nr:hypothetical protein DPEC_G00160840 [Dallia pectoralis]